MGPDKIIGVVMERSFELTTALLGVLKSGGAWLPLDPDYPEQRMNFILDDAGSTAVLTQAKHEELLRSFDGTVLSLDREWHYVAEESDANPSPMAMPHHLAYVIYTSGSTGQPKGCMIPHQAICNRLIWMRDAYQITDQDRILQKTPYTFDVSVWELFLPLLAGACQIVAKPDGHRDAHYLVDLINAERATVCHFVPSMLRFFLGQAQAHTCRTLRHVFASGEALPYDLTRRWMETMPAKLHNLYGPTEAAVDVSFWECEMRTDRKIPIGRAIQNIELYILDDDLRPVPDGEAGELHIGGIGLARGYLNRPELTQKTFVAHPFSNDPEARLYKTGDKARFLEDGNIEYLGRFDTQIKLRGFRIELGEIEAVLRSHQAVKDAAVAVQSQDDPRLVAYLDAEDVTAGQIKQFVKDRLPEYMVPNQVAFLDELPVSRHGKLDRKALPWPIANAQKQQPNETPAAKPTATFENVLAHLLGDFTRLVMVNDLKGDDDLFDAGATSLTVVLMVERIQTHFGVTVPVDVIMDTPTVAAMAHYVADRLGSVPEEIPPQERQISEPQSTELDWIDLAPVHLRDSAFRRVSIPTGFSAQSIDADRFGRFLSLLKQGRLEAKPKYMYASAGGLNPIQTYLFVKEDGVKDLDAGIYYYHPIKHRLHLIRSQSEFTPSAFMACDRASFAQAGFAVFFIAQMDAVKPVYQATSPLLAVLEAGYMGQLLVSRQADFGLGLRPVTGVAFDRIAAQFDLESGHRFIHCLLAGTPEQRPSTEPIWNLADHLRASGSAFEGSFASFLDTTEEPLAFLTTEDKDRLIAEQRHIRTSFPQTTIVPLESETIDPKRYAARSCKRVYLDQPVPAAHVGKLLALLGSKTLDGQARHLYPSITGTHDLEIYMYIKAGGVEGLDPGLYRYDPSRHALHRITRELSTAIKLCYTPFNRQHAQQAKFYVFLVAPLARWQPVFDRESTYLALLEAGYIGQMLLDRQAEFKLGICPIGGLMFDKIRLDFKLEAGDELIHSFVCGGFEGELPDDWKPIEIPAEHSQKSASLEDLAIVGLSGRYPGGEDLDDFLGLLERGETGFSERVFDASFRRDAAADTPETTRHHGGFLDRIDGFDAQLFKMTPVEARSIDPQERLLLETVWACLENAGYTSAELNRLAGRVGVFTGSMWSEYQQHAANQGQAAVSFPSSMANRISHFFGFKGPSIAVNTSCSSAMTALHYACRSIKAGDCKAAIIGGVNLMSHPYHLGLLHAMDFLSDQKEPRPFGLHADGWVPGEGVGAIIVKSVRDAQRDGDTIHGVIKGTALGFSGQAGRYGAPSAQMQKESMLAAIENAGVSIDSISYVEAAVSGASVADALETNAIKEIFQNSANAPTPIGSVKANIGHLESASAMSQLTKVLFQLKRGQIFPTLNTQPLNPMLQPEDGGLRIVGELTTWPNSDGPRRALINAFGATGSAGHLVLEEYPEPEPTAVEGEALIPLSAATPSQLRTLAARLHDALKTPPPLADIAHTLQVGRVHMTERLAFVADSPHDLREKLACYLKSDDPIRDCFQGSVASGEAPQEAGTEQDWRTIAQKWVRGARYSWTRFIDQTQPRRRTPLPTYPFARDAFWVEAPDSRATAVPQPTREPRQEGLEDQVETWLVERFAKITELPVASIDAHATFDAVGINSYIILQLNRDLEQAFGKLPKTLLFEYQTIHDLVDFFVTRHGDRLEDLFGTTPEWRDTRVATEGSPIEAPARQTEIAIIGISGRYPNSNDLESLWQNLEGGVDCISEIPEDRWDYRAYYHPDQPRPGKMYTKWGGFIEGVDQFDPLFFKMSPLEAEALDPQERLFLETVWHTFEDANYNRAALQAAFAGSVGVFVGVMSSDYQLFSGKPQEDDGLIIGSSFGSIANRISYFFDFHGPSMAVDTLCSSSLTALHLAVESIVRNECRAAVVGGVNLSIHPNKYIIQSQLTMSSSDGRCRSFGEGGDGFIPGEGVGAVLIKPLDRAIQDRDHIYGVIKGTSINHDGKTHGYTVPNPNAQADMIKGAIEAAGVDPADISYIEAHGTGTSLGDPVEIAGLTKAFGAGTNQNQYCALGSIKSNIGHLEAAAGMAGLTKILLQMKHGLLAPSLHAANLNKNIDFEQSPFYVQQELREWKRPVREGGTAPRIAGLSSFGAGGANAHAVIEEYRPDTAEPETVPDKALYAIPLSAKDEARLREMADNLLAFLKKPHIGLRNLAYTLQVGREPMEERLGFAATSIEEVRTKLSAFLTAESDGTGLYRNRVKRSREAVRPDDQAQAIQSWVEGAVIDWAGLYEHDEPRRIALPVYPFARERYWLPQAKPKRPAPQVEEESFELMHFEETWREQPLPKGAAPDIGTLVCFLSDRENQRTLLDGLEKRNPSIQVAFVGTDAVSPDAPETYQRALESACEEFGAIDGILYLWALEDGLWVRDTAPIVSLIQAIEATKIKPKHLVLAGGFRDGLERCYAESWIGFTRSLRAALPETRARVILQPIGPDLNDWTEKLTDEIGTNRAESVLYQAGKRHCLKVQPTPPLPTGDPAPIDGTVLITGGAGGLGLLFAEHLFKTRSVDLILTGRSPLSQEKRARLQAMQTGECRVVYLQADVCDAAGMKDGVARLDLGPITGVIHAAGLEPSGHIFDKTHEHFQAGLAAKIDGTQILDEVLAREPLEFVCYFSSTAAVLGDWGACDYAMANRFQTAYADYRNGLRTKCERQGRTLVLNWPLWQSGGMGQDREQARAYLQSSGQRFLETREGLDSFDRFLQAEQTQLLVFAARKDRIDRLLAITEVSAPKPRASRPEMRGLTVAQSIRWDLVDLVSGLMKIDKAKIDVESDLTNYGFDSISLANFAQCLTNHYGFEVTPAVFFGRSTLAELTRYFLDEHGDAVRRFYRQDPVGAQTAPQPREKVAPQPEAVVQPIRSTTREQGEPIAIIGMSGRFPQARSVEDMWRILENGENAVQEIPAERFDWRAYFGDPTTDASKTNCKWTGNIPGVAEFDPSFFEISPREAERMDPRQRLLLQESWNALEDAGYGARHIAECKTGMFVGVEEGEYQRMAAQGDLTSFHTGILAARLAYFLNLKGPTMAINTACSSSLVAAHQACQSLRNGECDTALAAGVNLMLTPEVYIGMAQAGMLSDQGTCFAFDQRADGMVPGEAVAVVVLKRLSQALRDGDPIHAVIPASGVNYDGKTSGITAPSGVSQTELIQSVYTRYHIEPESIDYIVAHGTGTPLGDPVEINALEKAFEGVGQHANCALTSTKTNFGHTFAASGLVSLIGMVQALRHETIPASLHCDRESDYIDWKTSPFYVNKSKRSWPKQANAARTGAVSSFGMSGTNAHMVVRDIRLEPSHTDAQPCYLLAFSAKTESALLERVKRFSELLERDPQLDLAGAGYTLLEGRHHFRYRLAMVVLDAEDARYLLQQLDNKSPHLFRGVVSRGFDPQPALRDYGQRLIEDGPVLQADPRKYGESLRALSELFCQGYDFSWSHFLGDKPPRRIHLPTYPFSRERYWIDREEPEVEWLEEPAEPVVAPSVSGNGRRLELTGLSTAACLEWELKEHMSGILKTQREMLESDMEFTEFGFDSIRLSELGLALTNHFQVEINPSIFFGYPTLEKLVPHLLDVHGDALRAFFRENPSNRPANPNPKSIAVRKPNRRRVVPAGAPAQAEPIAVIGMSGRFPQSRNVDDMWHILASGHNAVTEIPSERFDWRRYFDPAGSPGKTNCKWMGSLPDVKAFDSLFFEISPKEAETMDPRQRLLLQEAWNALEDAGYGQDRLNTDQVGMFVGVEQDDYQALRGAQGGVTSSHNGVLAARLAYFMNLTGPNMAINTACSSGLVAAHQAWLSLRNHECDLALAAGVNLVLTPGMFVAMSQSGMLSPDGKCFAFDQRANGMVPGEAVAVLVFKRLSQAERDGDPIYAVIEGSGVNYDGKTNGITAPSGVSQVRLLKEVYARHKIDPGAIDYIVTHGTGTKLGDPIEINALAEVFKDCRKQSCALTSTKTNFGHTFAASGLVSLIGLVQALRHETIPASLHCERENDYIPWQDSPFYVNKTNQPWLAQEERFRRGAVSAFGISGTNAHMVVREYKDDRHTAGHQAPFYLLALSAQSEQSLQGKTKDMIALLQTSPPDLAEISHTLLTGRHHFLHRCAVVARDAASACYLLQRIGSGEKRSDLFHGKVPRGFAGQKVLSLFGRELLERSRSQLAEPDRYQESLFALADLYCQGYDLSWSLLFGEDPPRRVRLPGYPFVREQHWVSAKQPAMSPSQPWLHPLLHRNTSDFSKQRFCTTLTGRESFLTDHVVQGRKVLPGVISLEMARAALACSYGVPLEQTEIQLKNVVWREPLEVDEPRDVHIALTLEADPWVRFEIYTSTAEQPIVHAQGLARMGGGQAIPRLDLTVLKQETSRNPLDRDTFYQTYRAMGIDYGAAHQGVETLYRGTGQVLARLVLPSTVAQDAYVLHPSIMDAAFQTPIGLFANDDTQAAAWLPFALEQLDIRGPVSRDVWALVREDTAASGEGMKKLHIDLCDDDGAVLVRMEGFSSRIVRPAFKETRTTFTGREYFLRDHHGILPGVVYLEMARAAASASGQANVGLRNVVWREPIRVTDQPREAVVRVSTEESSCTVTTGATVHFQAKLDLDPEKDTPGCMAIRDIQERCASVKTKNEIEQLLKGTHGPAIQCIETLYHHGNEALARLEQPDDLDAGPYELNPCLMNGAVLASVVLALIQEPDAGLPMPFGLDELRIHGTCPQQGYAFVQTRPSTGEIKKFDIDLTDLEGNPVVSLIGFALKVAKPAANKLFATQVWQAETLPEIIRPAKTIEPIFVLVEPATWLERALRDEWPSARIETLEATGENRAQTIQTQFIQVFQLLQSCAASSEATGPLCILAPDENPAHAVFSGLLKTARSEQLKTTCKMIVHPWESGAARTLLDRLKADMASEDLEIRYTEAAVREVKRVQEIDLPIQGAPQFKQGGVIWITGGLGGLGKIFSRHYGTHCKVVVSGRSALTGPVREAFDDLRDEGVDLVYVQGDVGDPSQVAAMVDTIRKEHGPLSGIIHAAGVLRDGYISKTTSEDIITVLRPKIAGVLALDEATRDLDLDFLIWCSSLSGVIGNPGQAAYAGANAFLDAFAHQRNQWVSQGLRRGKTLSIGWPLWKDGGMRMDQAAEHMMERATGMTAMDTANGLETLNRALQGAYAHVLVAQGSLANIRSWFQPRQHPDPQPETSAPKASNQTEPLLRELIDQVAELQRISPKKIEPDAEWSVYGFDSIGLTELANSLNQTYGLDLMPTVFYEYATISALAQYLVNTWPDAVLKRRETPANQAPIPSQPMDLSAPLGRFTRKEPRRNDSEPIAIIGLHGRFPGASDLEAFWEHLASCDDLITTIPSDRWDWRAYYGDPLEEPGKTKVNSGGFIADVACFDPLFFGISPREAETMDPQFRLFLETVWATIEDAGYPAADLAGSKTGVFVGASSTDYKELWQEATGGAEGSTPAIYHFIIANRISYLLDLRGPSEAIDTACSSSLIAIHRAVESIRQGNCDMALAGGVNVIISPNLTLVSSMSGMLSEDGRCRTFDKRANGYGRGEGVGAILLKPLDKAVADGDRIYGLIRGSAENHGGRATSPTAPNPASQQDLLVSAYSGSGIDPRTVGYIEAHGTGTKLGDPIEINGLKGAFQQLYEKHGYPAPEAPHCAVGSLKSNIGHLEAAAGIAGVIKVLMMLKHRKIPGNVHLKDQNPYLNLEASPFYLSRETHDWPTLSDARQNPAPRRAGVSSFGIGGSNAHLVLEEFDAPSESLPQDTEGPVAILFSAKNEDRLKAMAANLLTHLAAHEPALHDVAYTLQVGREAMKTRLAFTAASLAEGVEKLGRFLEGGPASDLFYGQLERDPATQIDEAALIANQDLTRLLEHWVKGARIDWHQLYGERKPRRIELPTYPFAKQRYWAPEPETKPKAAEPKAAEPQAPKPKVPEPQAPPAQWLFMKEDWRSQPIPDDLDWVDRLTRYEDKSILVVYTDPQDQAALCALLERLTEVANLTKPLRIQSLSTDDLDPENLKQAPDVVLFLGPNLKTPNAERDDISAVFHLSQLLMKQVWGESIRIFYLYQTSPEEPRLDCQALSGFVKSAMMENELHTWKLIEHRVEDTATSHQLLLKEWLYDEPTPMVPQIDMEIRHCGSRRLVKGLTETALAEAGQPVFRTRGTYLLAGGMGYIGELLTRKLAQRYQATLVILSRRPPNEATRAKCRDLEALGARVYYHAVDIADRAALAETYADISQAVGAIHGVVNLTRAHEDCMIATKPWASFQRVIRSKVQGSQNLDELTRTEPLDFFIMFSSLGAYGVRGSSDYAYATAFQNAFAHHRDQWRRRGRRSGVTVAQSWGAWVEDRLFPETRKKIQSQGFRLIDMDIGFPVIESSLADPHAVIALMAVDDFEKVSRFMGLDTQPTDSLETRITAWERRGEPLSFEELTQFLDVDEIDGLDPSLVHRIYTLLNGPEIAKPAPPPEPKPVAPTDDLADIILNTLCDVLKLEEADEHESFQNYGLDSISATVMATRLEKRLNREISSQWLLDYPTVRELSAYLLNDEED
ncbi:Amino acid adenylation domain-containing protein [Sulfidibacter corallicola]